MTCPFHKNGSLYLQKRRVVFARNGKNDMSFITIFFNKFFCKNDSFDSNCDPIRKPSYGHQK